MGSEMCIRDRFRSWLDNMNLRHPLVIAGPCSAETEEQVLKVFKKVSHLQSDPESHLLNQLAADPLAYHLKLVHLLIQFSNLE